MAGFFILLGDTKDENGKVIKSAFDTLDELCKYGYYSTNLFKNPNVEKWSKNKTATFADYFSMRKGDYVFFFFNRKIYGVAQLTDICDDDKVTYWAYKDANIPKTNVVASPIIDEVAVENRCICFFKPVNYFPYAIDMDEALTTYPDSFKSLRVIQGRSFIKMDDEESQALFAIMSKSNEYRNDEEYIDWNPPEFDSSRHDVAKSRISMNRAFYDFTIESLLQNFQRTTSNGINEEMAVEAAFIENINNGKIDGFDKVTYVSHQVSASPAKPVEYMEWMDVFGYSTSDTLLQNSIPIMFAINQYYVVEIKKDPLSLTYSRRIEPKWVKGQKGVANQLMKYVDWVAKNYANGKYNMVKGILIANSFDDKFVDYCKNMCVRNYNSGYRDSTPSVWTNIVLMEYCFDGTTIKFKKVFPETE